MKEFSNSYRSKFQAFMLYLPSEDREAMNVLYKIPVYMYISIIIYMFSFIDDYLNSRFN